MANYEGTYLSLGKTGIKVSRLAFGCGFRGVYDVKEAASVISAAIDKGINFIDCANTYKLRSGIHAEEALGMAIRGRREDVVITSKFGAPVDEAHPTLNGRGGSRYNIMQAVDASLKRIGTDHIDIYLMHMQDPQTAFEETMRALEQIVRDGKVLYAGLCNHDAWQIIAMTDIAERYGTAPVSVIQNPYNLLNRSMEDELLPAAAHKGIGVMTYSPLAAGLLGGAFAHGQTAPEKSTWGYAPLYQEYFKYVFPGRMSGIVDAVSDIAKKYGVSSATVATAWVLQNQTVTSAITGADNVEELEDSLRGATLVLEEEDKNTLDAMSMDMREAFAHPMVEKKLAYLRMTGQTN